MRSVPVKIPNKKASLRMLVDDEDYELLSRFTWQLKGHGYARTQRKLDGIQKSFCAHRLIMNPPKEMQIDHINGDTLDNRKANLRICTRAENCKNRKISNNNVSGFKGVSWDRGTHRWKVFIRSDNTGFYLGYSCNPRSCALAYRIFARILHGEFASW